MNKDNRPGRNLSEISRYDYGYQSLHFVLKQQQEQMRLTQIMMAIRINGTRYRLFTGEKVEPAFWNRQNGCCNCDELLSKRVKTRMEKLNLLMIKLKSEVDLADMKAAEHGRYLTIDELRMIVRSNSRKPEEQAQKKISSAKPSTSPLSILRSIADNFESEISNKGRKGASSSRKTYLYCYQRLEDYVKETRIDLRSFEQMNKSFYHNFERWLNCRSFNNGSQWKNYTASTVQNTLCCISNLHHKAYESGYSDIPACKLSPYRYDNNGHGEKIYLSEIELNVIQKLKPLTAKEVEIRDMFVLSAYTGLRISDINRLNDAVISDGTIRLFQKKTHGFVTIPILKEANEIIETYANRPEGFPIINHSNANKAIKAICRKARIDNPTPVNEYRGGTVQSHNSPKYELVSFHTARRSCITNLFRRGYSPNYLMVMSGHKSLSSFQRYIRTNTEELASDFIKELKKQKAI